MTLEILDSAEEIGIKLIHFFCNKIYYTRHDPLTDHNLESRQYIKKLVFINTTISKLFLLCYMLARKHTNY